MVVRSAALTSLFLLTSFRRLFHPSALTNQQTFRGQHGKAYLFNTVHNIIEHEQEERGMTTGKHIVRDISCRQCTSIVGWKYDKAYEEDQTYKEGKFILEYELLKDVH